MKNPGKDTYGFEDRSDLIIKVNYSASLIAALFGIIGFFYLDIRGVIPYTFIVFAFLNVVNTLLYQSHKNLLATYIAATLMTFLSAIIVSLSLLGIQAPLAFHPAYLVSACHVNRCHAVFVFHYLISLCIT